MATVVRTEPKCCARTAQGVCGAAPIKFDLDQAMFVCADHVSREVAPPTLDERVRETLRDRDLNLPEYAHGSRTIGNGQSVVDVPALRSGWFLLGRELYYIGDPGNPAPLAAGMRGEKHSTAKAALGFYQYLLADAGIASRLMNTSSDCPPYLLVIGARS